MRSIILSVFLALVGSVLGLCMAALPTWAVGAVVGFFSGTLIIWLIGKAY